jgi:NosR/NirI family nitrous oxide reductase transcriptional regulator
MSFTKHRYEYKPQDVLPEANEWVNKGDYWEGYKKKGDDKEEDEEKEGKDHKEKEDDEKVLIGYAFLTNSLVKIPGYSGETINTLVGMDLKGNITGVKIVEHSEPIVLIGISEKEIHKFVSQYIGKNIKDRVIIGKVTDKEAVSVDAITGATVTAIAENATILEAGRVLGLKTGIISKRESRKVDMVDTFEPLSFEELAGQEAIKTFKIMPEDLGAKGEGPLMTLFFGILDPPSIGKNLVGERYYAVAKKRLDEEKGIALLYMGGAGSISFKGSGFARGGIFDRFSLEQGGNLFVLYDRDYINLTSLEAGPKTNEGGIFIIKDEAFDPTSPFKLQLTIPYRIDNQKKYATFIVNYELPQRFIKKVLPFWVERWKQVGREVGAFSAVLLLTFVVFSFRDRLSKRRNLPDWFKYPVALISIVFFGWYLKAQPSTTQILSFINSGIHGRDLLQVPLSEPFLTTFWIFIILGLLLWGRGYFCGWLCPYGVLLELSYRITEKFLPNSFKKKAHHLISKKANDRLIKIKYFILFAILALSFYNFVLAEIASEVEPFKTFILGFKRPWYYVLYMFLTILASTLIYRFFCRYLCPLGAALAIVSRVRRLPIKRYRFCTHCTICTRECEPLAISPEGKIDPKECLQCWNCVSNYYDTDRCPVLITGRGK